MKLHRNFLENSQLSYGNPSLVIPTNYWENSKLIHSSKSSEAVEFPDEWFEYLEIIPKIDEPNFHKGSVSRRRVKDASIADCTMYLSRIGFEANKEKIKEIFLAGQKNSLIGNTTFEQVEEWFNQHFNEVDRQTELSKGIETWELDDHPVACLIEATKEKSDFLQTMSGSDRLNNHEPDTMCGMCHHMYLMAQVARDMIMANDTEDPVSRWAKETERRWQESKFYRLYNEEVDAGRDPHQAFERRGWET